MKHHARHAGGSLGPEAALLALCGATTSWVARRVFGFSGHRLRNMTLLGMTAGLAAFFGVALGGTGAPRSLAVQLLMLVTKTALADRIFVGSQVPAWDWENA